MDDEKVLINTDYIKLGQLLKLASLVSQGSDAKTLIVNGYVSVNGETVLERGKKNISRRSCGSGGIRFR